MTLKNLYLTVPTHEKFLSNKDKSGGLYNRYGKRVCDVLLCIPTLVPLVLLLLVVYLASFRSSQRLFFVQKRVGKDGSVFDCYKLQTMVDDADAVLDKICAEDPKIKAEWDTFQKLANDPRITPIGHILRKTSLDELPQIINVLKGDMSLVGPRPFTVDQAEAYLAAGGYGYYHVRPGITGPWQVSGRGRTSFLSRVRYDNLYYRKKSFWTDFKLLVATVRVVLVNPGT